MSDSRSPHMNPQFTDGALSRSPKLPTSESLEHLPQLSQEQDCSVPQPKFIGNFYRT